MRSLLLKRSDVSHNEECVMMTKRSVGVLLLFGLLAFVLQPTKAAQATPLAAGGFYQGEDHSFENHSGQTLDAIDLSFGSLAGSNVKNSSLVGAFLEGTDFTDANLQGVDLTNAYLFNATFTPGVNLKNADLTGANLAGIDLTGVNLQNVTFTGAYYDATSVLPFDPTVQGMVYIPEISPLTMVMMGLLIFASMKDGRAQAVAAPNRS
jgi:hypothetical protein